MKKILLLTFLTFLMCGCNEYLVFTDRFVSFDLVTSSVTSINEAGDFVGTYNVHYTGETPAARFAVTWEIIAGEGLKEGVDFEVENSSRTLTFMPGVFSQPIRIHWLPHELDGAKDNSLVIRLKSGPEDVILGMPGPDGVNRQITIIKYKN